MQDDALGQVLYHIISSSVKLGFDNDSVAESAEELARQRQRRYQYKYHYNNELRLSLIPGCHYLVIVIIR